MPVEKLIIVGSGIAGFTAAIYASRANLSPLVLTGTPTPDGGGVLGGQLTTTTDVENFPGFPEGVMGPELMVKVQQQAERFGTRVEIEHVSAVDFSKRPYTVTCVSGRVLQAEALILSTGASAKYLGLPNEKRLGGRGVSACATCDGFFFKGKELVVVGGGDTAMEEAGFLTKFATKVTLIHRQDKFRASPIMLKRAQENPKIVFKTPFQVLDVLGSEKVEGLTLEHSQSKATEQLRCDGLFLGIGHRPNSEAFPDLDKDEVGYLKINGRTQVFIKGAVVPGVFAAGDLADHRYRQAVTAAGTGCAAALEATRFLEAK
ncbi:MAG: thioredoxin-disulfide reductase [candidate division FCPU426 bacterium]